MEHIIYALLYITSHNFTKSSAKQIRVVISKYVNISILLRWKYIVFSKLGKSLSYYNHFSIGCSLSTFIASLFAVFSKYGTILSITSAIHARIRANRIRIYITSCTGAGITTSRGCTRALSTWCTYNNNMNMNMNNMNNVIIIIIM